MSSAARAPGTDSAADGSMLRKLATGIAGFDHVSMGGLPVRRATVLAGQAGSAKTVFAAQFLAEGVRQGQPGVFVTLEEPAVNLRANLATLGWDVDAWEKAGDWRFVDASPLVRHSDVDSPSPYSVETLAALIGHAVDATGAERLVIDSLNGVLALHQDPVAARQLLHTLISSLRGMGVTIVLTVETPGDPGGTLSRYGVEEFVADSVVLLRNVREGPFRRRTLEVLKMRGAMHHKGDVGFTVVPGRGLEVLPVTAPQPRAPVVDESGRRVSSGVASIDALLHGGLLPGSSLLMSGPTGTGKTLLAVQFAADGLARGERVVYMAYEETREQVLQIGDAFGLDLAGAERRGLLTVVSRYPEVASLDNHLVEIRDLVRDRQPGRLIIDSLSALERIGSPAAYREFVIGVTSYVKTVGVSSFMAAASPHLVGATSVTESHISGLVDTIVVLRHVEVRSTLRRGILVLKMRGSSHDHAIHELLLADGRIDVGDPFKASTGIMLGQPTGQGPQG